MINYSSLHVNTGRGNDRPKLNNDIKNSITQHNTPRLKSSLKVGEKNNNTDSPNAGSVADQHSNRDKLKPEGLMI
jgi:hypothetical protein